MTFEIILNYLILFGNKVVRIRKKVVDIFIMDQNINIVCGRGRIDHNLVRDILVRITREDSASLHEVPFFKLKFMEEHETRLSFRRFKCFLRVVENFFLVTR